MNRFENSNGKIDNSLFEQVMVPNFGKSRSEVITGPKFGVDTCVIDLGNGLGMAASSDPLSLIPALGVKRSAWLSVHLMANDLSTTGCSPMYAQFVLNLPVTTTTTEFKEYWHWLHHFCNEAGVAITGGHTGRIEGQNSTISGGGTMFLTAPIDRILTSEGGLPGDRLIVTKQAGLAATSILALSFPETVRSALGNHLYNVACENFWQTSCLAEGLIAGDFASRYSGVTAMHDVTEGGVLGAIKEMAVASGCGFLVDSGLIPSGDAVRSVAKLFDIDPALSVGAGSMVIAVRPKYEKALTVALADRGIPACSVGTLTEREFLLVKQGRDTPFRYNGIDPYWNAFFRALKQGWR